MPSYTAITDATLTAGKAITETLLRTIRNNLDFLKNATDGLTNTVVLNSSPAEPSTASTSFTTVTTNRLWLAAGTYTFRIHAEVTESGGNGTTDTAYLRIKAAGTTVLDSSTLYSGSYDVKTAETAEVAVASTGWTDLDVQLKTSNSARQAAHRHVSVSWTKTG